MGPVASNPDTPSKFLQFLRRNHAVHRDVSTPSAGGAYRPGAGNDDLWKHVACKLGTAKGDVYVFCVHENIA